MTCNNNNVFSRPLKKQLWILTTKNVHQHNRRGGWGNAHSPYTVTRQLRKKFLNIC